MLCGLASSGLAGLFLLYPSSFLGSAFSLPQAPSLVPGFLDLPRTFTSLCSPTRGAPFQSPASLCLSPWSLHHSTNTMPHWILEVPTRRWVRVWLGDSRPPQVFPTKHCILSYLSVYRLALPFVYLSDSLPRFPLSCFFSRSSYITLGGGLYYHPHLDAKDTEGTRV